MIFQKFWPFKKDWQLKTWKVYGLMGNKFNTDFSDVSLVKNFSGKKDYKVITKGMYQSPEKRYGKTYYQVGEWPKHILYKNLIFREFGAEKNNKSFFYPMDLIALDKEFSELLGPPKRIHDAIMLTSGRSLLVIPPDSKPFILKIGTYRYSKLKNFSMRFLSVRNILNCLQMTRLAQGHHHIFKEDSGGVLYARVSPRLSSQNELTYLIRSLDLDDSKYSEDTVLLPLTAVLSSSFWANDGLLNSLNLSADNTLPLFQSLAEQLSDSICTSLSDSFLHFMAHQQNLSIAVENNRTTALIYHDLHDTLVDAINYLLQKLNMTGFDRIDEHYAELYEVIKQSETNLNNQLLYPGGTVSGYDVLSYYLRFYKYLSQYDKYFARLSPVDDLFGEMAERIYNDKRLARVRNRLTPDDDLSANRKNLFWLIDRAHYLLEAEKLKTLQAKEPLTAKPRLTADEVHFIIFNARTVCSRDFPKHLKDVEPQKIEAAYDLYMKKVIFVIYDGKPCLLIAFQGVIV